MGSCFSQGIINLHRHRMRAAEHAPRGPFRLLVHRHGLAEIVERGAGVCVGVATDMGKTIVKRLYARNTSHSIWKEEHTSIL